MKAVIQSGGKQYIVAKDQVIQLDRLNSDQKKIEFAALMTIDDKSVTVGTPTVKGVTVTAEVLGEIKGAKVRVLKFKAKKRQKRLTGHRQRYAEVKITAIS